MSGTWRRPRIITDTVTAAEASAGKKIIFIGTGVPTVATDPVAYVITIKRANIDFTNKSYHEHSTVSGAIVVKTNSTDYILTENDVISLMCTYV